ncbi:Metalloenzyme, LuxS/M16 peptidase-like protein [Ilyonectria destructans]|nr:Metalloenzyme, LuxS/M16 peptidase-like protein [Ilyonectria destructans]
MYPGSGFRQINDFKPKHAPYTVSQYASNFSGLRVSLVNRKGPKINGYFALATEPIDDSGALYALGHLVSMGSGLLKKLSSRAFSDTGVEIGTDRTVYTQRSVGWEAFVQIFTVHLQSILKPSITEGRFATEVFHVNGEGNDAGVVYSAVQARQTRSRNIMEMKARRLLYPDNVGFRYDVTGVPEAVRALTPERIREFHQNMYHLGNLCLVIVGEIDCGNLFQILGKFEESIKADIPSLDTPFQRPWMDSDQPPALNESKITTVEFPGEDETVGEILVGFFGPNCIDTTASSALSVLLTYLCGSSASILENVMVEDEKLASSVTFWWDSRPNSVIWLQPTGVATKKLEFVEKRLFELLNEVASKPLDMKYMRELIRREKRWVKCHAEASESFYVDNIITDYLFGERDGLTLENLQNLDVYDALEKWEDKKWRDFLRKWISDAHHISVLGKPSLEMASKMKKDEEARIANRKEELGSEGLVKLGERLEEAKRKNDEPIPASLIDEWAVPDISSISLMKSDTARAGLARDFGMGPGEAQKVIDAAPSGTLPLFHQFEHTPSKFVHIIIHMGTSQVPDELKPLLPIFRDNFFNTPIMRGGKEVSFEQVVKELEDDTVNYSCRSARSLGDADGMMIHFDVEPGKYAAVAEWTHALMFDSVFDPQRLMATVAKALADIPTRERDGRGMANEVAAALYSKSTTLAAAQLVLKQASSLKSLEKMLREVPEKVVSHFNTIRKCLFTSQNIRFLAIANLYTLPNPLTTWDTLSKSLTAPEVMYDIPKPVDLLSAEGRSPGSVGAVIIPKADLSTSYFIFSTKGPEPFSDPSIADLTVAIGYLRAVKAVHDTGTAYNSYLVEPNSGVVSYCINNSPVASEAISASKEAIRKAIEEKTAVNKHLFEGVISQSIIRLANEESTMYSAAYYKFLRQIVYGLPTNWNEEMLRRVCGVTAEGMRAAMRKFILPCFEPRNSDVIVTCDKLMQKDVVTTLENMGYKVNTHKLSDFSNLGPKDTIELSTPKL